MDNRLGILIALVVVNLYLTYRIASGLQEAKDQVTGLKGLAGQIQSLFKLDLDAS